MYTQQLRYKKFEQQKIFLGLRNYLKCPQRNKTGIFLITTFKLIFKCKIRFFKIYVTRLYNIAIEQRYQACFYFNRNIFIACLRLFREYRLSTSEG